MFIDIFTAFVRIFILLQIEKCKLQIERL